MSKMVIANINDLKVVYELTKDYFNIGDKVSTKLLSEAGNMPLSRYHLSAALRVLTERGMFINKEPERKSGLVFEFVKLVESKETEYIGEVPPLYSKEIRNVNTKNSNLYTVTFKKTIMVTHDGFKNLINDNNVEVLSFTTPK